MQKVIASGMGCTDGIIWRKAWSYNLIVTDSGRSQSRRPKQTNDCTVRAYALAFGIPYDAAYDQLAGAGRKCAKGFNLKSLKNPQLQWTAYQAIKDVPRITISDFCAEHQTGRWIIRVSKHVVCVINGVLHDTHQSNPCKCVYGAWEILP